MDELISVIIPTYNREKLIKRSIDSVLNQTYKNIEVIVIDDGSIDNTEAVVKSINNDKVKYIKIDHSGAGSARNKGIEIARGEYIAFNDSDDVFRVDKLQKQYEQIKSNNCDVIFCAFERHSSESTIVPQNIESGIRIYPKDLLSVNIISTQTVFAKTSVLKNEKFDVDLKSIEDWELALRLVNNYDVRFYGEVLVDQYIQNDSISNNKTAFVNSLKKIIIKNIGHYRNNMNDLEYLLNAMTDATKDSLLNDINNKTTDIKEKEVNNFLLSENAKIKKEKEELLIKYESMRINYNSINNSFFWKMTYPIRKILDQIKNKEK